MAEPTLHTKLGSLDLDFKNIAKLDWRNWENIDNDSKLKISNAVNSAIRLKNHTVIIEKYLYHEDFVLLIGGYNPPILDGEVTGIFKTKTLEHVGWFFTENSR